MKTETAQLGDVCEFVRGITFPSGEGKSLPFENSIACLTTSGVQRDVAWNSRRFVQRARVSHTKQMLQAGDILISTANSKELVGKSCLVHQAPFPCTFGAFVTVARAREAVYPPYLAYWMTTRAHLAWCFKNSSNTTNISNLRVSELEELRIALPNLSEQQQIATRLEQADRLCRTRRYVLELTDTFLSAAFREFFGDVRINTKEWDSGTLGEVIIRGPQNGLYKPASAYGAGTPILRIDSFYDGAVTELDSLKRVRLLPDDIECFGLSENDIVVNRVNSRPYLGKSALIPKLEEPTVFESNMMRLTLNTKRAIPVYVTHYLQTSFVKSQIQVLAKDAVNQSSINQEDVKGLIVRLPPIQLQQTFATLVEHVGRLRAVQREALRQGEHLFASLLHSAFSV